MIAVQQGSWLASLLLVICVLLKTNSDTESVAEYELKRRCVKPLTGGEA